MLKRNKGPIPIDADFALKATPHGSLHVRLASSKTVKVALITAHTLGREMHAEFHLHVERHDLENWVLKILPELKGALQPMLHEIVPARLLQVEAPGSRTPYIIRVTEIARLSLVRRRERMKALCMRMLVSIGIFVPGLEDPKYFAYEEVVGKVPVGFLD